MRDGYLSGPARFFIRLCAGLAVCWLPGSSGALTTAEPIYVVSQDGNTVSVLDTVNGSVVSRIEVADKPVFIAVSADGKRGYVTHPDSARISVLNLSEERVQNVYDFPGEPFSLALSADERSLFVSDWKGNAVVRLNAEDGRETGRIAVGKAPAGLTLDRACKRLFVADRASATVSVIDSEAWTLLRDIEVGASPFAVAAHGSRIYVANVKDNTLSSLATDSLKEVWRTGMQAMPYGIAISDDGQHIWVTAQQKGVLQRIDSDGSPTRISVKVGRYPEGVAILGDRGYVANWFDDAVAVVDLGQARVTGKIEVAAGPRIVAGRSSCKKE